MWRSFSRIYLIVKNWIPLESPLDCKEIQPVHPKGNQSWIFIGRTDAEAETSILWPPHAKNWLIGKDLDAGKDWRQEEKGTTEDEMVWWHHRLDGHEFEQAPGVGDRRGRLACCSPWGRRVRHNWATELNWCYGKWTKGHHFFWAWDKSNHVKPFTYCLPHSKYSINLINYHHRLC